VLALVGGDSELAEEIRSGDVQLLDMPNRKEWKASVESII
jgi:hypothetical protein